MPSEEFCYFLETQSFRNTQCRLQRVNDHRLSFLKLSQISSENDHGRYGRVCLKFFPVNVIGSFNFKEILTIYVVLQPKYYNQIP